MALNKQARFVFLLIGIVLLPCLFLMLAAAAEVVTVREAASYVSIIVGAVSVLLGVTSIASLIKKKNIVTDEPLELGPVGSIINGLAAIVLGVFFVYGGVDFLQREQRAKNQIPGSEATMPSFPPPLKQPDETSSDMEGSKTSRGDVP